MLLETNHTLPLQEERKSRKWGGTLFFFLEGVYWDWMIWNRVQTCGQIVNTIWWCRGRDEEQNWAEVATRRRWNKPIFRLCDVMPGRDEKEETDKDQKKSNLASSHLNTEPPLNGYVSGFFLMFLDDLFLCSCSSYLLLLTVYASFLIHSPDWSDCRSKCKKILVHLEA